jgi:hypothetical protein
MFRFNALTLCVHWGWALNHDEDGRISWRIWHRSRSWTRREQFSLPDPNALCIMSYLSNWPFSVSILQNTSTAHSLTGGTLRGCSS